MTTRNVLRCMTPGGRWVSRVLLQYWAAASLRTITGAGSQHSSRVLRAYLNRLAVIVAAAGALSARGGSEPPRPTDQSLAAVAVAPQSATDRTPPVRTHLTNPN